MTVVLKLPWGRPLTVADLEAMPEVGRRYELMDGTLIVSPQPGARPLTRADLALMPDDGHRYELLDGTLIVTPAPSYEHQNVVGALTQQLRNACPPDLRVLPAPFDVVFDDESVLQPDVLVARRDDLEAHVEPLIPLLVIEVLSPSTKHIDKGYKQSRYMEAGIPSYWIVDPLESSVTIYELHQGAYVETALLSANDVVAVTEPFPVTFSPTRVRPPAPRSG